jgi:hypothetical protein
MGQKVSPLAGTNRALCGIFRLSLARIGRCVVCADRLLTGRDLELSSDLVLCKSKRHQRAGFARFVPVACCTTAHLCQRPSKSTAHRPISASVSRCQLRIDISVSVLGPVRGACLGSRRCCCLARTIRRVVRFSACGVKILQAGEGHGSLLHASVFPRELARRHTTARALCRTLHRHDESLHILRFDMHQTFAWSGAEAPMGQDTAHGLCNELDRICILTLNRIYSVAKNPRSAHKYYFAYS